MMVPKKEDTTVGRLPIKRVKKSSDSSRHAQALAMSRQSSTMKDETKKIIQPEPVKSFEEAMSQKRPTLPLAQISDDLKLQERPPSDAEPSDKSNDKIELSQTKDSPVQTQPKMVSLGGNIGQVSNLNDLQNIVEKANEQAFPKNAQKNQA